MLTTSSVFFFFFSFFALAGFKALLRYEGFDNDNSKDFWCNLCIPEVHPVGWCASSGKPLVPPKSKPSANMRCSVASWCLCREMVGRKSSPPSLCSLFLAGIQHKYSNWKAFLVKRLTGAKTLPPDFSTKVGLKTRKINVARCEAGLL